MWALGMTIYALVYGWKEPPVFMTHQKFPSVLLPEVSFLSESFQSAYGCLLSVLFNQDPHFDAIRGFQQQLDIWNTLSCNKPGIKVVKDNQWVEVQISKSWMKKISKIAKKWL
jgi:hypothetical protein